MTRGMVCVHVGRLVVLALTLTLGAGAFGQTKGKTTPKAGPVDPGVRGGVAGAGGPLKGLVPDEKAFFQDGQTRFLDVEVVTGGANNGLGPRFNSNQCFSCHSQPEEGGSSPAQNPLIVVATLNGAKNTVPWFITAKGPVREARFVHSPDGTGDGEVHDLRQWDLVRVAPEVVRAFEAGPNGLDILAVGGPRPEDGDGVMGDAAWPDGE